MGRIVAIGGMSNDMDGIGEILRETISLAEQNFTKIAYIPTANKDHEWYCGYIKNYFESNFNCNLDSIKLLSDEVNAENIRKRILSAHVIFVEGGNTMLMLEIWKKYGVDKFLKEAYEKDIILSGLSAGAICWFEQGHSDSKRFYSNKSGDYIFIKGLGLINAIACPHFDSNGRKESFKYMLKRLENWETMAIGIDNNCALLIDNDKFKIISPKKDLGVHRYWKNGNEIFNDIILNNDEYVTVNNLLKINI